MRVLLACSLRILFLAVALATSARAQDESRALLLVAAPGTTDPNFRETVVLVTEDDQARAVGVILNRPTQRSLASILPGERFRRFTEPVFLGGPVEPLGLFAVFRADKSPGEAVSMLPGLFLTLNPETIDRLFSSPPAAIRFYAGYSGWGPGQLRQEVQRGGWYLVNADEKTVFRKDTDTLWRDLIQQARSVSVELPRSYRLSIR